MTKRLDIQPQQIAFGTITTLLNGAITSLSGPIGFSLGQPTIHVKGIWIVNPSIDVVGFSIFKGNNAVGASGTQVISANAPADATTFYAVDTDLESTDYLTATCTSSTTGGDLIVNITADIEF